MSFAAFVDSPAAFVVATVASPAALVVVAVEGVVLVAQDVRATLRTTVKASVERIFFIFIFVYSSSLTFVWTIGWDVVYLEPA